MRLHLDSVKDNNIIHLFVDLLLVGERCMSFLILTQYMSILILTHQ